MQKPVYLFLAALLLGAGPARADCAALDAKIRDAVSSNNTGAMPGLSDAITADASCDSTFVEEAKRAMARAVLMSGQKGDGSFAPDAVRTAAAIARPWEVNVALGDLLYEEKDYSKSVEAYEGAINEIRDSKLVPEAPPAELESYLAKRAYQAKSLAPDYVSSRGFRGEPAGVIVPNFRNFSAVSVPVPIRFNTGEASLTEDGKKAVDDLYNFLQTRTSGSVTLIGHTDPRGPEDANMALSEARAAAVAEALKAKGLSLPIKTLGKGESEPFAADDRSKYKQDELFAFDRRVEFELVN